MGIAPDVYRTERGTVWRIIHTDEGGLHVQLLKNGEWVPGRIGMAGLRLSPSTTQLTAAAIRELPV